MMPFGDIYIGVIVEEKITKINRRKWITKKEHSDSD